MVLLLCWAKIVATLVGEVLKPNSVVQNKANFKLFEKYAILEIRTELTLPKLIKVRCSRACLELLENVENIWIMCCSDGDHSNLIAREQPIVLELPNYINIYFSLNLVYAWLTQIIMLQKYNKNIFWNIAKLTEIYFILPRVKINWKLYVL